MNKKTQVQKIADRLRLFGHIDNFYCIENKLTYRLGARIHDLKELGWEFRTEKKGKNWYYYPTTIPDEKKIESRNIAEQVRQADTTNRPVETSEVPHLSSSVSGDASLRAEERVSQPSLFMGESYPALQRVSYEASSVRRPRI